MYIPVTENKVYVQAYLIDHYQRKAALLKVPVEIGSNGPELPEIVRRNGYYAKLVSTNPATYMMVASTCVADVDILKRYDKDGLEIAKENDD